VPGAGSTFHVHLPLATDARAAAPTASLADFPGGTEALLVVDDEGPLRTLLATAFTRKGYRVSTAATGLEAIDLIADQLQEIDAVLLDLNMPGPMALTCSARSGTRAPPARAGHQRPHLSRGPR